MKAKKSVVLFWIVFFAIVIAIDVYFVSLFYESFLG